MEIAAWKMSRRWPPKKHFEIYRSLNVFCNIFIIENIPTDDSIASCSQWKEPVGNKYPQ
jgi:hypothetical protein